VYGWQREPPFQAAKRRSLRPFIQPFANFAYIVSKPCRFVGKIGPYSHFVYIPGFPRSKVSKTQGLSRGRGPLTSVPAPAACTPERMKAAGFLSLQEPPAAPKAQAVPANSKKWRSRFFDYTLK